VLDLVVKDLIAARWFLLAIIPLYVLQLVGSTASSAAFGAITLLSSALLAAGALIVDESQGTDVLWCSLPVSRREIVFARYASAILGVALGVGLSWIVGRVGDAPLPSAAHAALFSGVVVALAVFLPCYYRWGAGRALAVFAVVVLVVSVALTGLVLSVLRSNTTQASLIEWLGQRQAPVSAGLIVLALAAAATSAAISALVFRRRDC
jgi:ABC-2 type transport system permease protein